MDTYSSPPILLFLLSLKLVATESTGFHSGIWPSNEFVKKNVYIFWRLFAASKTRHRACWSSLHSWLVQSGFKTTSYMVWSSQTWDFHAFWTILSPRYAIFWKCEDASWFFLSASSSCSRFYIFVLLFFLFHNLVKMEHSGTFWNILEHSGITLCLMA